MTTLVVFLLGGADGGSMVAPSKSNPDRAHYESLRPSIKIDSDLNLNENFIMHPAMQPLMKHFESGDLSVIAGIGGSIFNRSHFAQQKNVQYGNTEEKRNSTGFFGQENEPENSLDTVALEQTDVLPIFHGDYSNGFAIPAPKTLRSFYNRNYHVPYNLDGILEGYDGTELDDEAAQALDAVKQADLFSDVDFGDESALPGAARSLARQGKYIAADVDKKMKFLSFGMGGWDHHRDLNRNMQMRLNELSLGLDKCWENLGERQADTSIVVITEFGRTYKENGTGGTDHGYGTVALLLSKQITKGFEQNGFWDLSERSDFREFGEKHNALQPAIVYNDLFNELKKLES